jgi:O-antigen/teichoic acid export membrane protein
MKELTRFSGALLGFSAMNQINIRSVDVIGLHRRPTATGVFRLARTVLDLAVSLFLNPINNTLLPIFSRMVGDRQRTMEAMWRACGITSLVASVPFVASASGLTWPSWCSKTNGRTWPCWSLSCFRRCP